MIVADASPLIVLTRVSRLSLLPALYDRVLIPPAVRDEAARRGVNIAAPMESGWLTVRAPRDIAAVAYLRQANPPLDPGESEAIVLAGELGVSLILDERKGHRVAQDRGLIVTGTVGVVLAASRIGIIAVDDVEPLLRSMVAGTFWLSERVIRRAVALAHEQRP